MSKMIVILQDENSMIRENWERVENEQKISEAKDNETMRQQRRLGVLRCKLSNGREP